MANPYCYWDEFLGDWTDARTNGACDWNAFPDTPNTPVNHTGLIIKTNTGGSGGITYGQSWLDKILQTATSVIALGVKAPYVPTDTIPPNQTRFPQSGYPTGYNNSQGGTYQGGNAGAQFGGSLQNFITNNTGLLLIGGAALVLLMMKPPSRRNGSIIGDMQKILGVKNPRRRRTRRR